MRSSRLPILLVVAAAALALPLVITSNYHLRLVNLSLIFSLLAVSLNIVLGYAGQIALGHAAFFGIGAYTAAIITAGGNGLLFWPAFFAAGLVTGLSGLVVGIPTLRLKGHYLALGTLGFGEIMRHVFFNWREVTHGMDGISNIPFPSFGLFSLNNDAKFYYLALAVLGFVMVGMRRLARSKYGRMLTAVRDAELAAGTSGVNVTSLKVVAFFISAVIAGFAGSLYAHLVTFISPDVFVFDVTAQLLSMVLIGGIGTPWGPVLGAFLLTYLPEMLRVSQGYYQLIYGAGIAFLVLFLPGGLFGLTGRWRRRGTDAVTSDSSDRSTSPAAFEGAGMARKSALTVAVGSREHRLQTDIVLEARSLSCRFGGVLALDNIDLDVKPRTIHALIGPNGSGKSTLINIATGIYKPTSGIVAFEGRPITGLRPWQIANAGVARTFQNLRLFGSLSVMDNVLIACRASAPAGWLGVIAGTPRVAVEDQELRRTAEEALSFVGLWDLRDRIARNLPHEQQRLIEIARALAQRPRLILLDEPAAGMNPTEGERLVQTILRMREVGITVLLIEHNMPLVMRVADHITVLNFGRRIAEGNPAAIKGNDEVVKAYLGHRSSKGLGHAAA